MKEDVEYEKLTKEIYEALLNADGINSIEVRHNVKIQGQSAKHQIDVYWEYELAGIRHKVAIECKNYNKSVSKGVVTSFYGVLTDIGNINGVIVTKKGFQRGAKEYAERWGINLKELREPTDKDWEGRVKTIHTTFNIISKSIVDMQVIVDEEWIKEYIPKSKEERLEFHISGRTDHLWIKNKHGEKIISILQIENGLPINNGESAQDLSYTSSFDDGYITTTNYGDVKIKEIIFKYHVYKNSQTMIMEGSETAKAIIKDALTGELKFISKDGTIN